MRELKLYHAELIVAAQLALTRAVQRAEIAPNTLANFTGGLGIHVREQTASI
jgi:hypothetical protein